MDDGTKASVATAIAGGYVLGRTKKGRLALTTAALVLGRRFGADPQQLVTEGVRRLRAVPQVSELEEQVRTEALGAARKAISAAVGRRMESVTSGIGSRLAGAAGNRGDEEAEQDEGEDSSPSSAKAAKSAKTAGGTKSAKSTKSAKKGSGRPAERTAAPRKPAEAAAKHTAPAKRTATAPARKAASKAARSGAKAAGSGSARSDARAKRRR